MNVTLGRHGKVAVVTIDNPPVNALSTPIRAQLVELALQLEANPEISAIVLCGAGRLFVGGADISEFDRPPEIPTLPDLIAAIESATKPWVAALHGATLGGGLELALGCHHRIAAPGATLGLPEVGLGLIPGAGGTQRLPRLIGLANALPVVTEKHMLTTEAALACGLVEGIAEGPLTEAAIAFAVGLTGLATPARQRPLADPGPGFWQTADARLTKASKGQTAPLAALESVHHGVTCGVTEGLAFERATFLRLRASEEAAALRHLFFAERAAPRPAALRGIAPRAMTRVGVVGGGTMGAGIAAALRIAGLPVTLSERDEASLQRGLDSVRGLLDAAARRGLVALGTEGATGAVGLHALADCDLVIEAVFEDLAVKRAVFADLAAICGPEAILATNTSYIDPRLIAADLPNPARVLGLHFFSPAHVMKLLEIIPLPATASEVLATVFDLARRLGKVPVRAGICEGFIGNRILKRTRAEAETLLREGIQPAAIDAAMRGYGYAMGPFEMQDMAGLDISFMNREAARARGETVPETPGDLLVRAGRKGIKSGGGWYDYAPGDRKPFPSPEAARLIAPLAGRPALIEPETIAARMIAAMAAEGAAILAEGIADSPADIDLVLVHGYGFPRTKGGPMFQSARKAKA